MAVGDNGTFYNYQNGVWTLQSLSIIVNEVATTVTNNLTDVYITDNRTAWITGAGGLVLKSTNGGASWVQYFENGEVGTDDILAINFEDRENGVLISTNGVNTLEDETDRFAAKFWYDELGRLILSQNSKQHQKYYSITGDQVEAGCYSYTLFDAIGRTTEVGEVCPHASTMNEVKTILKTSTQIPEEDLLTMLGQNTDRRYEVTQTLYDDIRTYANEIDATGTLLINIPDFSPKTELLRNRVAAVNYSESYQGEAIQTIGTQTYNHATYYDYDIHGNVKSLVHDQPLLAKLNNRYKRTDYHYDLISGNVLKVAYQEGEIDQLYHRYAYDADNRITQVETSSNGVIWDKDAKYNYYQHGPLAQTITGDQEIQSAEHVYTLQGWLKTVNGEDRNLPNTGNNALEDEMGYALAYFDNDYKAIGINAIPVTTARPTGFKQNLYNGNISEMATNIKHFDATAGANVMQYKYDQLNRLVAAAQVDRSAGTANPNYNVNLRYDRNGNIETLTRTDGAGALFDNFTYTYKDKTDGFKRSNNQLRAVADAAGTMADYGDLPSGQTLANGTDEDNYQYDNIGNLTTDLAEDIDTIIWRVDGKIKEVRRTDNTVAAGESKASDLEFGYDAMGRRVFKLEKPRHSTGIDNGKLMGEGSWKYTHYVCDASGNAMAVYKQEYTQGVGSEYTEKLYLEEQHLYGSSKCGILKNQLAAITERVFNANLVPMGLHGNTIQTEGRFALITEQASIDLAQSTGGVNYRAYGNKSYQFSNHLGNVLAVTSDLKIIPTLTSTTYTTTTLAATDYMPFGMQMPSRTHMSGNFRYGFNGMDKDDEMKGSGNSYDFGARMYDSRIGRWFAIDPKSDRYSGWSPYHFAGNSPLILIDPNGKEWEFIRNTDKSGNIHITINFSGSIIDESGSISDEKMNTYVTRIKAQFKESLKGSGKYGTKTITWNAGKIDIKVAKSIKKVKQSDHVIYLTEDGNMPIDPNAEDGDNPNRYGYAVEKTQAIYINQKILDNGVPDKSGTGFNGDKATLERTAMHEALHTADLLHPQEQLTNDNNLVKQGVLAKSKVIDVTGVPNVMSQSSADNLKNKTVGLTFTVKQIIRMTEQYEAKALNNGIQSSNKSRPLDEERKKAVIIKDSVPVPESE
jgi:RHS repeat-associated protein